MSENERRHMHDNRREYGSIKDIIEKTILTVIAKAAEPVLSFIFKDIDDDSLSATHAVAFAEIEAGITEYHGK